MGQVLYRKYRSKSLEQVVGQKHITTTLENALKSGKVGHALLLTGPRGVGKTSVARILAHRINDLSYSGETKHIDIIEIDAASNRRIDEIRELREKSRVLPTLAKYKVYIIDEVHMLTREAFNALLKTLEEPPQHVIFILATTDVHKLPDTIISRTQVFNFRPIESGDLKSQLLRIAKEEGINIAEDAAQLIAAHASGSFRDALSILDQARSLGKKVGSNDIEQLLGIAPKEQLTDLLTSLRDGNLANLHSALQHMRVYGAEPAVVSKQLAEAIREELLLGTETPQSQQNLLQLLDELLDVKASIEPQAKLEIVLLKFAAGQQATEKPVAGQIPEAAQVVPSKKSDVGEKKKQQPTVSTKPRKVDPSRVWPEVLAELKAQKGMLYSVARLAVPSFEDNTLYLDFEFALHMNRAKEQQNTARILEIVQNLTGQELNLVYRVTKRSTDYKPEIPKGNNLESISNIFGDAEVLD